MRKHLYELKKTSDFKNDHRENSDMSGYPWTNDRMQTSPNARKQRPGYNWSCIFEGNQDQLGKNPT